MKILDVGCSNGALGASLRALIPHRSVCGIEFDPEFCKQARAKLDRVVQADLDQYDWNADFPAGYFDCIIFADVLEHLNRPWQVLKESTRLLSADGMAIISLPNIRHVSALYSIFIKGKFPRASRGIFDRTHLRWFTLADGIALCADAGLSVVKVSSSLRLFDVPGGKANHFVQKTLGKVQAIAPIREFLTYQFVLMARRT
jgi:methionine biosynthesis protein MetW